MSLEKATEVFNMIARKHSGTFDEDCEKLYDYYREDHKPHMDPILSAAYPNAMRGGMKLVSKPLVKRLVNTTATLFHKPPLWKLLRDGKPLGPDDREKQTWDAIDAGSSLNSRCKMTNRGARRDKTAVMGPAWRGGMLRVDVYRPCQVFALLDPSAPGDAKSAKAVMTQSGEGYMLWTPEVYGFFTRINEEGEEDKFEASDPLQTGYENPYGRIPLTFFYEAPGDDVIAPLGDTLISAQEAIDTLWTVFKWAMQQGFTMNVIITDGEVPANLVGGPDKWMKVPGTPDTVKVERLSAELDADGMVDFVVAMTKTDAIMHAADPGVFSLDDNAFANSISGVAKEVDRADLMTVREDDEPDYQYYLSDFFDATRAVHNYHAPDDEELGLDLTLEMEFVEPRQEGNALQEAQAEQIRIENGTATVEEIRAERAKREGKELGAEDG